MQRRSFLQQFSTVALGAVALGYGMGCSEVSLADREAFWRGQNNGYAHRLVPVDFEPEYEAVTIRQGDIEARVGFASTYSTNGRIDVSIDDRVDPLSLQLNPYGASLGTSGVDRDDVRYVPEGYSVFRVWRRTEDTVMTRAMSALEDVAASAEVGLDEREVGILRRSLREDLGYSLGTKE